jgi:hypothetical protein
MRAISYNNDSEEDYKQQSHSEQCTRKLYKVGFFNFTFLFVVKNGLLIIQDSRKQKSANDRKYNKYDLKKMLPSPKSDAIKSLLYRNK